MVTPEFTHVGFAMAKEGWDESTRSLEIEAEMNRIFP